MDFVHLNVFIILILIIHGDFHEYFDFVDLPDAVYSARGRLLHDVYFVAVAGCLAVAGFGAADVDSGLYFADA